jgi:hypothetical protein
MHQAEANPTPSGTFKKSDADYMATKALVDATLDATTDRRRRKKVVREMGQWAWPRAMWNSPCSPTERREAACVLAAVAARH